MVGVNGLLEREAELARLDAVMRDAGEGRGGALLIEGEAGMGKSALLRAGALAARECGLRVLEARGGELEHAFAWGLVRQLLERELTEADEHRRATLFAGAAGLGAPIVAPAPSDGARAAPAEALALEHGLYWLVSNLAEERPLALLVDDLHWGDVPTLRFLVYLARRLEGMPIALVAAVRLGERGASGSLMDALRSESLVESVELDPLGEASVDGLVAAGIGRKPEPEFGRACHEVSGGNPFLLSELLRTLADEGAEPTDASARRVREVGPVGVSRSVLLRLARLPAEATALAQAVAVLGVGGELRDAAALAELSQGDADRAADALTEARILAHERPLQFLHPLVRNAIYTDLPGARRARDHKRTARLLADHAAALERVVGQLLLSEPAGDEWVVATLGRAAETALARGAPEAAVEYLHRAVAEPPPAAERVPLLAELGGALARAGRPQEAVEELRRALELTDDARARTPIALGLGQVLFVGRRVPDAVAVLEEALQGLGEGDNSELALQVETMLAFMRHTALNPESEWLGRLEAAAARASEGGAAQRSARAVLAFLSASTGAGTAVEVALMARRASRGSPAPGESFLLLPFAAVTIVMAGHHGEAIELIDRGIQAAVESGDQPRYSLLLTFRSRMLLDAGRAREAEADARAAVAAYAPGAASLSFMIGILILALVERGQLDESQNVLDVHADQIEAECGLYPHAILVWARGRLRIAQGRYREALEDLEQCGEVLTSISFRATDAGWRSDAALAHLALGEVEPARRLAVEELELMRAFGASPQVGVALRARGLAEGGERGLALLRESVTVLEGSEARLEHARSLVALGAALRRGGQRRDSRESLRAGLDLASRCGAPPLAAQAREELVAAGGRPRTIVRSGADALTPSERRVCRLAAEGLSNPEIAQSLFVTRATVESHLHSAYGKLEIASRRDLKRVLASESP